MRYRTHNPTISAETDMTPMIDVTFQLIAFFMFVLNFGEADQDARVQLPSSQLAKPPEVALESPLVLQLTKEGRVIYAGEELPMDALPARLIREREALERLGGKVSNATVVIRADAAAKTGVVQELIRECQEERYEKFVLRAMTKQEDAPP